MNRRFIVVVIVLLVAFFMALFVCGYPPRDSWRQPPTREAR